MFSCKQNHKIDLNSCVYSMTSRGDPAQWFGKCIGLVCTSYFNYKHKNQLETIPIEVSIKYVCYKHITQIIHQNLFLGSLHNKVLLTKKVLGIKPTKKSITLKMSKTVPYDTAGHIDVFSTITYFLCYFHKIQVLLNQILTILHRNKYHIVWY